MQFFPKKLKEVFELPIRLTYNALHITRFAELLTYQHILFVFIIINMVTCVTLDIYHKRNQKRAVIFGMTAFLFTAMFDLVKYYIEKYIIMKNFQYVSFLFVGTLIFVIALIIDFCLDISSILSVSIRNQALEDLAYQDSLTGLFNRRKCEEEFKHMNESDQPFGMISFDLNNLKKINDTKGHEMGDKLICAFATILIRIIALFLCMLFYLLHAKYILATVPLATANTRYTSILFPVWSVKSSFSISGFSTCSSTNDKTTYLPLFCSCCK